MYRDHDALLQLFISTMSHNLGEEQFRSFINRPIWYTWQTERSETIGKNQNVKPLYKRFQAAYTLAASL